MMFPEYTRAERLADGVVHIAGTVLSIVGAAVLLTAAISDGEWLRILAAMAYASGLLATFGLSAAYNLARSPRLKESIRPFDHAAIYVMIAGTYTPFALVGLGGGIGNSLLAVVWTVAVSGMLMKLAWPRRFERVSIAVYVALGWLGLLVIEPMVTKLPESELLLLGLGGALYTAGVAFHLLESLPYQNAIWHLFVLAAAGCHYAAVLEILART